MHIEILIVLIVSSLLLFFALCLFAYLFIVIYCIPETVRISYLELGNI